MYAVILAGGRGSRLGYLTKSIPKPMVKIGGKPIIWHLLKILNSNGINNFIICLGYKGNVIKNYLNKLNNRWNIKCLDTGPNTLTAKRIFLVKKHIKSPKFLMTYGDGLANINLNKLYKLHCKKKKIATVTAVSPIPRFGSLVIKKNNVTKFNEKPKDNKNFINGGFFILDKKIFDVIDLNKNVMWEQEPMKILTKKKQLSAYFHNDFWHPMDTERDQKYLNELYKKKKVPWKV
tara:strand:+ start:426 stop:1127 length:702 start_codon:yes stop_codon:yes gene_type:complete